ncbi:Glycine-rich RNA-binding protein 3, mitochondrial [Zea mays]|uniref:Glycine-rich RNA-binding protein 3, mitochondrial n=1 Tax=Zea mays TaxID=4577 RepID=A0A3L6GD69_MAIZE|nr:Glycine-rich RNA-binding protein 3, mitochondrial [Zea mays]
MAAAVARSGFRRMFSVSAFAPPKAPAARPKADPSPNLFVSGLSKRTTSEGLRDAFAEFGEVLHARVVTDRVSGFSKGFGFVRYATTEEAAKGIEGKDGKFLDGWVIFAEYAKPRPPPEETGMNSQPQQSWGAPSGSWGAQ